MSNVSNWRWVQYGWYTRDGKWQPTSPRGDIVEDLGDGNLIRIASEVLKSDAEMMIAAVQELQP